jgi:polysaccharide biosynthesis/export protein
LRLSRAPAALSSWFRPLAILIAAWGFSGILVPAFGQGGVPLPVDEQVRMFQSLPPAQQQALIRELQEQLPPAQRQAIVRMLQEGGPPEDDEAGLEEGEDEEAEATRGLDFELPTEFEEPKFEAGSTLVVQFSVPEDALPLDPEADAERAELMERLANGNPYRLDSNGQLVLPGIPPIALAGLNVDQATVRIEAEPSLRTMTPIVTLLPLEPAGSSALQPFGYDLFSRPRSTFAPVTDIPVPIDYVLGPGDNVYVQLFGAQNTEYFLPVTREGTINFPEMGPVNVSGLTFSDVRTMITDRVREQMIGVRASVTLGELRSIRVFVLGDVTRPSSYTVSGLSTMTNALLASGGVQRIGSLRNIALRRGGETITTLDLYDLLLRGDTRGDAVLQPGDVIFVPPIGPTVAIDGAVRRPAIYEIKGERTVADVVALAGGLNPNANRSALKLERIVPGRGTTVEDVDLSGQAVRPEVRDGDVLRVLPNLEQLENSVRLEGNVFQPGPHQWYPGIRLSNVLPSPALVRPMSDLNYVLIRREREPNVAVDVLSADLGAIWQRHPGATDVLLEPRDTVYVFNLDVGRQHIVRPIIAELESRSPPNTASRVVRIEGQVRAQGEYPLEPGMRVSDLLRAGGGLAAAAYVMDAELTRHAVIDGEYRETELLAVDLAGLTRGNAAADIELRPYDFLNIKELPRWRGEEETISVRGEVVFPGTYPIRRGESLSSVLSRAGGLTELAFPEGSIFTRRELVEREQEQLEALARKVERDLAAISVTDPNASETISIGQTLITQLRESVATGRLVIRLDDIAQGVPDADIILKHGDQLIVPNQRQEVTVLGEVQYATSHVFQRGLDRDAYINMSGGLTSRADRRRIYVVRASGEVVANVGSRWFQRGDSGPMRPGDSIVVPLDVDQPLARWTSITQIIYQFAIAAAAVSSF